MEPSQRIAISNVLAEMARFEQSTQIDKLLLSQPGNAQSDITAHNAVLAAFLGGDLAWLDSLAGDEQLHPSARESAGEQRWAIAALGIDDLFERHQKAVNTVVGPYQTRASIPSVIYAENDVQIACTRQVAGDKTLRHRLLGELRVALIALYESAGYEDAVGRINILGAAIVSHPAFLAGNPHTAA
jgi:hypothetical protein